MPQNKRRGTQRQRKGDESGSDSADERSPDGDEPSLSPEVPSEPPSRRSSNVGRLPLADGYPSSLPSLSAMSDRRDRAASSAGSSVRPKDSSSGGGSGMTSSRSYFPDGEVPHIATLPQQDAPPTPAPMSAPTLPPIRPASDLQAAQRKRAATVPGKPLRPTTSSGPKVVACNYCRSTCLARR